MWFDYNELQTNLISLFPIVVNQGLEKGTSSSHLILLPLGQLQSCLVYFLGKGQPGSPLNEKLLPQKEKPVVPGKWNINSC